MAAEYLVKDGDELDESVLSSVKTYRYIGMTTDKIKEYFGLKKGYDPTTTWKALKSSLQRLKDSDQIVQIGTRWLLHPDLFRVTKGHAIAPEFQWTDVLILFCISHNGSELVTLKFIAIGVELVNRSPLTLDDMHGALNRLSAARLIKKRKQKYFPSKKATDLLEKARKASGAALFDQAKALQLILACPCCGAKLKRVTWKISVTEEEMEAAYQWGI